MYSDKLTARTLTALLAAHGVRRVVVCAGSRNAPLVHTLCSCPELECLPAVDERSACFEACGLAQASGEPAAVCVTSGSAMLDAAPAVCEAYYQELPLVLITADRPDAWIDQRDGQTMRQPGALAGIVRCQVSLPENNDAAFCQRLINMALLACRGPVPGPVHINVPLDEPLFGASEPALPRVHVMAREERAHLELSAEALAELEAAGRILIVAGQLPPDPEVRALLDACADSGMVVSAEHLANAASRSSTGIVTLTDMLLGTVCGEMLAHFAPDLVITVGGQMVGKRLKLFLRGLEDLRHWHVGAGEELPDVFRHLTRHVRTNAADFLRLLVTVAKRRKDGGASVFQKAWLGSQDRMRGMLRGPLFDTLTGFSDLSVMAAFLRSLPSGRALHLANSMPVRNAQCFSLPEDTLVYGNRGVNGIDGSLSAALGNALVCGRPLYCCIGDLSFFYDANALWRDSLPASLRILLFNNGGGCIFRSLPGLDSPHRAIIAGSNTLSAASRCRDHGIAYQAARDMAGARAGIAALHNARGPALLEVFTDPDVCVSALHGLTRTLAACMPCQP